MAAAPTGVKYTAPAFVAPPTAAQATLRSGTCSRIAASHSRFTPAISATQWTVWSSTCVTCWTPPMNWGNSSNCVHWLYTARTGASTWMDFSTLVVTSAVLSLLVCALTSAVYPPRSYLKPFEADRRRPRGRRPDPGSGCGPAPAGR